MSQHVKQLMAATFAATLLLGGSIGSTLAAPSGSVWWVDDDGHAGPNGCGGNALAPAVIQVAIDAASPGDTVRVCPGNYTGPIEMSKAGLTVMSTQSWQAIIRANPASSGPVAYLHDAANMKLKWFRILAPTATPCMSLETLVYAYNAAHVQIRANHIAPDPAAAGTDCTFLAGIALGASANSRVMFNRVTGSDLYGITYGGSMDGTRVVGNTVTLTYVPVGHVSAGFGVSDPGPSLLANNWVHGFAGAQGGDFNFLAGVWAQGGSPGTIAGNHFTDVNLAIALVGTSGGKIHDNVGFIDIAAGIRINGSDEIYNNRFSAYGGGSGAGPEANGSYIHDNNFDGPSSTDCSDFSIGTGTSGTADTWMNNIGAVSNPAGLCTPPI